MPSHPSRLALFALLASTALAACTTTGNTPRQVPSAQRSGQSWVVTRPQVAAALARACPGGLEVDITDFWAPSRSDIDQLESHLPRLQSHIPQAQRADRQYVGVISGQRRLIYLRGFPATDNTGLDPTRAVVVPCDIGWHALYDPHNGQFTQAGQTQQ